MRTVSRLARGLVFVGVAAVAGCLAVVFVVLHAWRDQADEGEDAHARARAQAAVQADEFDRRLLGALARGPQDPRTVQRPGLLVTGSTQSGSVGRVSYESHVAYSVPGSGAAELSICFVDRVRLDSSRPTLTRSVTSCRGGLPGSVQVLRPRG